MWKWMAAGVLALAAVEGAKVPAPAPEPNLNRVLFFATLEGLCEEGVPDAAVQAVLEKDGEGRYRHFVYACPVCSPVVEGFRAYALRRDFYYGRKGDPLLAKEGDGKAFVADPAAALHDFVERCVARQVASRRLTEKEASELKMAITIGMKKGNSLLPSSGGFAHKSCPSCDGGSGKPWTPEK